jgi:hypothetical protein
VFVPIFVWSTFLAAMLVAVAVAVAIALTMFSFTIRKMPAVTRSHALQFIPAAKHFGAAVAMRIEALVAAAIAVNRPNERVAMQVDDIGRLRVSDIHIEWSG